MGLFKNIKTMVTAEDPYGDNYGIEEEVSEEAGVPVQKPAMGISSQEDAVVELKVVRPESIDEIFTIANGKLCERS